MKLKYLFEDNFFEFEIDFHQILAALGDADRESLLEYLHDIKEDYASYFESCGIGELVWSVTDNSNFEEYFEEYLKDYFETEARKQWREEER